MVKHLATRGPILKAVLLWSEFLAGALRAQPGIRPALQRGGAYRLRTLPVVRLQTTTEELQCAALRRWRQREMALIAWRALAGIDSLEQTLAHVSQLADTALRHCELLSRHALVAKHGHPQGADGQPQELLIVAMGKLGGGELNFSSDIDLIFLFPEQGETDGKRCISNEEFFTRQGQLIIRLLDSVTADGFVFRVDMRLRPFGDSGALVSSFEALEDYLQRHGRDWERYAWVKARAVTGSALYANLYRNVVRPFVYRRYLDFGVFEALREMKALIENEVARRDIADNIKLGSGGIREIEFVVQALQLLRGGSDRRLQETHLLDVLPRLVSARLLTSTAAQELEAAYRFLRILENCLQMRRDEQTHLLPKDSLGREQLASALQYPSWQALKAELTQHRTRVATHFSAVVFGAETAPAAGSAKAPELRVALAALFNSEAPAAALPAALRLAGVDQSTDLAALLLQLRDSSLIRKLDDTGRQRLQALIPELLFDAIAAGPALELMRRLLRLLEAIGARSAYFSLLREQPVARQRLVRLATHGDYLIDQIAAYPLLLDELIDSRALLELPDRTQWHGELIAQLERVDHDDEERIVLQLRHFQRAALFRIAVADLEARLPLMQVSDCLTMLAELILEQAMQLTWQHVCAQLGVPRCGSGRKRRVVRICAVGYGKLGGRELGYTSDLDLVFLHDSEGVDNQVFFVRFAQRLMHLLSVHTSAGRLYDVDVRLRPSGKGGLLITSIDAFADYQKLEAWTWEHQALLHARAVAGDALLRERFETLRMKVLCEQVHRDRLLGDVRDMRSRMLREQAHHDAERFDLKKDAGGMTDIEFLAQYWALKWAGTHPPVAMYSDTLRQLESVASANLVPQADIDVLGHAYRRYREILHHRSLAEDDSLVPIAELSRERAAVSALWQQAMQL